jgi:nucleotide-binding universal stress UspA family protein
VLQPPLTFDSSTNIIAMQKILVPCDFTTPAINAFRFALDCAAKSKGTVYLLNVIELPILHDTLLMPVLSIEEQFLKDLESTTKIRFRKLTDKYNTTDVKVITKIKFGSVSKMIQEYIETASIDIVIMGSHGATGAREFFIGSNAERIVRYAKVPVLVTKDYYKGPIKNIVFPNTLETEDQEDLVTKINELQNFFKAHLHLVWINTPLNFASDTATRQRLETFAKRFMLKNYTISVFNHTDEERGIMEFSNTINGDLIAMGTHGRKGIAWIINGSLAEDVVNHNQGLVWTYTSKNVVVEA